MCSAGPEGETLPYEGLQQCPNLETVTTLHEALKTKVQRLHMLKLNADVRVETRRHF
jgi:hypothetical protein